MLTCATALYHSVDMKAIITDLLNSYNYIHSQTGLREDLHKAGALIDVDPRRCAALGWSAGGSSVIYLVSLGSGGNCKWRDFNVLVLGNLTMGTTGPMMAGKNGLDRRTGRRDRASQQGSH
jgi:hypothetical protein